MDIYRLLHLNYSTVITGVIIGVHLRVHSVIGVIESTVISGVIGFISAHWCNQWQKVVFLVL